MLSCSSVTGQLVTDSGSSRSSVQEQLRGSIKCERWSSEIVWKWHLHSSHTVWNLIMCLLWLRDQAGGNLMGAGGALA